MFPMEIWLTYTAACVLLVLSLGPDNILAIGRGLSQGRAAALVSGLSSGAGILFHVAAATFGLTLLMQTSAVAFWFFRLAGAGYLIWLGVKVLRSRSLISFTLAARQPLRTIFSAGFLSAPLNPKPGLFVLAFTEFFCHAEPQRLDGRDLEDLNSGVKGGCVRAFVWPGAWGAMRALICHLSWRGSQG